MRYLAIILAIVMLSGCAAISKEYQKSFTEILDSQVKVVQAQINRIPDLCLVGLFDMGVVEASGVINPDDVSSGSTKRAKRLEELCARQATLTPKEMGEVAVLGMRLWVDRASLVVQKSILPLLGVAISGLPMGF